ncbi:MAG TPA: hypothetical protein VFO44_06915 [Steroidobacteraceae bacterium]|nr:hypothetical protein [Steroidobacteraceae bacterium]
MPMLHKSQVFAAALLCGSAIASAQELPPTPTAQAPNGNGRETVRLATAEGVLHAARATPGPAAPQPSVVDHSQPETARDSQADAPETARDHEDPRTLPETAVDSQAHSPETAQDSPADQPETAVDSQKGAPETAVDDPHTLPETATDALRASDAKRLQAAARAAVAAPARATTVPQ